MSILLDQICARRVLSHSFPVDIARLAIRRSVGWARNRKVKLILTEELEKAGLLPYSEQGFILPYSSPGAPLKECAAIVDDDETWWR